MPLPETGVHFRTDLKFEVQNSECLPIVELLGVSLCPKLRLDPDFIIFEPVMLSTETEPESKTTTFHLINDGPYPLSVTAPQHNTCLVKEAAILQDCCK